ncbi:copper-containing nitrite reductase [Pseudovibrio sp. WM33]|uniref:copper-containing nitrite reductase n=1 Tax=Pseudovibrio sp. WM33 TaxID=1735585 RepID=UPI0007AE83FF|nr:copper-containing nitrite reductase [Pseudovibrio sp. WM33]KZL22554.1 Copper-containing nitrite reductase precursor [Pseudovibrio sp. WM33]
MTSSSNNGLDRRSFLKVSTVASSTAAFGAFAVAANQAVAATKEVAAVAAEVEVSLTETEISALPRVKQELVAPPFAPKHDQVAQGGPKVVEVTMTIKEMRWEVDDTGAETWALTFDGSVPGPLIVCHEGDYVELTLINPETNRMDHNIDFHSSTGALGGGALTHVLPGEQVKLRWKAVKSGVFVYHCAPEGQMIPYHVVHGMNGAVMVLPREGLKDKDGNPLSYDDVFYVGEQDFYIPKDENGDWKVYEGAGDNFGDVFPVMRTLTPTHVVFNGKVGALTGDNALKSAVGRTALFIHAQSNRDTRPHLIGGHGDYVWETGSFADTPATGLETWFIRGGSAGAALYTFRQPGVYVYLNHNLIEAIELGAASHIIVDGEWNDDLMKQVSKPGPIPA